MAEHKIVMELAKMLLSCYRGYGWMLTFQTETDKLSKDVWEGWNSYSVREWLRRKLDFGKLKKEIGLIVNDYVECKARQMPYK